VWGNCEYIEDGKTQVFYQTIHLWCNSMAVIWVKLQNVSFNLFIKNNRLSKGVVVPAPCHEGIWQSGSIAPLIPKLGTRWSEWSISCPATLLQGKIHGTH